MSGDPDKKGDGSDHEDYLGEEEESDATTELVNKLALSRPDVLAALQVQTMPTLPASVKKRIKALKKIQLESTKIEAKFHDEVYALERKYHLLYTPQYEKRAEIISGKYEPTEEECEWDSDKDGEGDDEDEEEEILSKELEKKVNIKVSNEGKPEETNKSEDVKGIPEFWLTIFKNVSILQEMLEEHDIPILAHLEDIKVVFHKNNMGFTLEFHFSPNEYFQNSVLTKEYEMKCAVDENEPFGFEGPEIIKSKGCPIEWAKGKNVTVKTVKKKQKHKGRGEVRVVTKTVRRNSFFNFFSPPVVADDAEIDDETESLLSADFEIGHYIRDRIVPRAVLYYTGEALDEEEDEFEEEEGEEDSEDEFDEEDSDFVLRNTKRKNVENNAAAPELCTNDKALDKTPREIYSPETKSYKSEYLNKEIGSYSRGGVYTQSAVTTQHGHESGVTDGCNIDELLLTSQDKLGLEAIKLLHRQLDDDADGNVDLSESDEFLREDLKYEDQQFQRRQQAFHRNDDKHISVRELWDAWLRSEVHNWTVEQTSEWLAMSVELPQYIQTFVEHRVTGATLPRLAVSNSQYLSGVLGVKDPIHKQKIALKAMDVVLFGPPKDFHHPTKDIILVTLLLGALVGCWYAYRQNKLSRHHLRRMMKDMESLHKAELALEDLQRELEHAKKEQENVATEKLNLERRLLEQAGDGEGMRLSYSDLEVTQLKQEVEMLRNELQRAEGELQDRCWVPPVALQHWLQMTHEIENKAYMKKRMAAEKQLQQAREACEKLRKKRSSLVGAFVSTHGKSIDDVDRSIVEARTSLNEVTSELQERVYRWKQIESLCGFSIINNSGLPYLESVLYRNAPNGRGPRSLGRVSSSQDDLDDDNASLYSPSAGTIHDAWKEDSSGSDQGKNEPEDEFHQETQSVSSNVQFTIGGDQNWGDDLSPIPSVSRRNPKSSMIRSFSQDNNVNTMLIEREKEKELQISSQSKLAQSDTDLGAPISPPQRHSHLRKLNRDLNFDLDDLRQIRKEDQGRKALELRRLGKDQEDTLFSYGKVPEGKMKNDYVREMDHLEELKKASVEDFRRAGESPAEESKRILPIAEEPRRQIRLEDGRRIESSGTEDRDETLSTDSNSTAAEDLEAKKKKRKLFGNFRKPKSKS